MYLFKVFLGNALRGVCGTFREAWGLAESLRAATGLYVEIKNERGVLVV